MVADIRTLSREDTRRWTDRLDGFLTQRVYGMAAFAVVMAVLFEALFTWSAPLITGIEIATSSLQNGVTAVLPPGILSDLLVDGVIAGVGNVVVFVPQIGMLFFFIAMLEDVGYLARVAFVIDRADGTSGAAWQGVRPDAVRIRLRHSGGHGDAHHREPARPV